MRSPYPLVAALAVLLAGAAVVVFGIVSMRPDSAAVGGPSSPGSSTGSPTGPASPTGGAPPSTSATPGCPGPWDCAQQARFAAAAKLVAGVRGHVGIVVRDRVSGAVWQAGEPGYRIWAGSTPKLALAVALREEARAGQITLDAKAQSQIAAMLHVSDNAAADALWNRYVSASTIMARFRDRYGMSTAGYVTGFPSRWGFVKCTPRDLANLVTYILEKLDATDRTYIVNAMRSVGDVQHWGVWGAGAAWQPGVKDGWSIEKDAGQDHWITATAGFVGPHERYVVAAMYHQFPGGDSIEHGVRVLTDLVATVFGAPVPAPVVIPQDY